MRRIKPRGCVAADRRDELAALIKKTRSHGTIAKGAGLAKRPKPAKGLPFSSSRVGRQRPVRNSLDHFAHNAFIRISAVRRKDDAEQHPLVHAFLLGGTDMSTAIRRDDIIDPVTRNRHPGAVYLHFVVVSNHTTLGRPTIH